MEQDIPLRIEIISEPEDSRLRIDSAKEVEFVLQQIATRKTRVALYYDELNDFLLTTVLGINRTGLWLEQSQNEAENERIAKSGKLVFVSSQLKVKVQFTSPLASNVLYLGIPAIFLPFPQSLYRLQRREYFRLLAPVVDPLRCVIAAAEVPAANQSLEFVIMDISCGGVGLTCKETGTELTPGISYPSCQIELPEVGTIKGRLDVKNLVILTSATGKTVHRAGCEFKNLDGTSAILLQKYITQVQRLRE
ncbi:MAG: flagellar regulator YcgR PilZN domain-containing protein [Gallionella sp.]